jgi:alpha-N-arabinofuranosidase
MEHVKATSGLRRVERKLDELIALVQDACNRIGRTDLIKVVVDEWNEYGWEEVDIEKNALPEQYDLAHALYTAGFLNLMLRRCNNISMANYSPVVNTRGLIFADNRGALLRSSYFVYQLYKLCARGLSILSEVDCPNLEKSKALALDVATVQASENIIYLFTVNRNLEDLLCQVNIPDFNVKTSSAKILTADNLKSYNSFEKPDVIIPKKIEVNVSGDNFIIKFPKHSLSIVRLEK